MPLGSAQPVLTTKTELTHVSLLRARIAAARFDRYVDASDGDAAAALRLYEWNIRVSGAFHETLGQFEILIRNALDEQLRRWHRRALGGDGAWYRDASTPLNSRMWSQIEQARRHATQGASDETHGKVVAELTFGFWRFLLDSRYQGTLWAPALRHAFPYLRPRARTMVSDPVMRLNGLRNRIAHHEPIHGLALQARWEELLTVAGYVCPASATWIWSSSRVPAVMAARPGPSPVSR